ncbi:hypothetical protein COS51_00115 [Candidatus Roizmanbacteria bacterium CG03_land_8_20_14_0_80_36_21]|nr:MAG: hypothetical protein COS51_00115 [Candidatus Roizmanbacteria bacterium CG03_land_8_20_14_0_80_36_21]
MNQYKIYYDAFQEAKWFQSLNSEFENAELLPINQAQNSEALKLLRYDKPDIILLKNEIAALALEKTTEVPTGHNVGQRFARIVCSAEEKVPFIYFFPFVAMKHGEYASACWINARLLEAMKKLREIHSTPIVAINWECDNKYELIRDGSQDLFLREVINDFVKHDFKSEPPILKKAYEIMRIKYQEALTRHPQYSDLPPTAREMITKYYINTLKAKYGDLKFNGLIRSRTKSLIYDIGMKYVRSDPYTGTQLIYDYLLARKGTTSKERTMNIVLRMPNISSTLWKKAVAKKNRKDIKLYTKFADLIELSDGIIIL